MSMLVTYGCEDVVRRNLVVGHRLLGRAAGPSLGKAESEQGRKERQARLAPPRCLVNAHHIVITTATCIC